MARFPNAVSAAIAFACLPLAVPALAQEREPVTARVRYADLDLSTQQGRAILDQRLRSAASAACVSKADGLAGVMDSARCRHEMQESGVQQIAGLVHAREDVRVAVVDRR